MFSKYNAKDTTIMVDGVYITGLGEDIWSFEKAEDLAENSVGAQGDVVRNEINDPIYNATVTVQQTSPQANFLFGLKNRTEPFPIYMINKALRRKEGGAKALMSSVPEDTLGKTAEDLAFGFTVYDGDITATE